MLETIDIEIIQGLIAMYNWLTEEFFVSFPNKQGDGYE